MAFSVKLWGGTAPRPRRSSGTKAKPSRLLPGGVELSHGLSIDQDGARFAVLGFAAEERDELALAVSGDPGDPDDLPRARREGDVFESDSERRGRAGRETAHLHGRVLGGRGRPSPDGRNFGSDHQARELAGGRLPRIDHAGDGPGPEHRRDVAKRSDLVELVADVEDAAPVLREPTQGPEQALDRGRRQHRSRFVEDEELRLLEKAAHDLDPLALADRKVVDMSEGVDRHPISHAEGLHLVGAAAKVEGTVRGGGDVLHHRRRLEEGEVLVDHLDPERARQAWIVAPDALALEDDLA
jgi:hypothetical protein